MTRRDASALFHIQPWFVKLYLRIRFSGRNGAERYFKHMGATDD